MNVGIMGAGSIAGTVSRTLGKMKEVTCFTVASRDRSKAENFAKEYGFDLFSTTLTVSPHKNSDVINEVGNRISKNVGVEFLAGNFKKQDGYKKSIELSKKYNLYRQNYCGCRFSRWFENQGE